MQATLSSSGVVVARDSTTAQSPTTRNPLLIIQLQPEPKVAPLIAEFLPPDLPHVEDLPLQGIDVTPGALAFEFSHSRIAEAFDKLQDDIQQWSADLVDDPVASGPVDVPPQLLQQQEQVDQEAGQHAAGAVCALSAVSEQGSLETDHSGDAGKHASSAYVCLLPRRLHDSQSEQLARCFGLSSCQCRKA